MRVLPWIVLGASLCGGMAMLERLPDTANPVRQGYLNVPPPAIAQVVAGFRTVASDLYYLRFVSYWGYQLTHGRHFQNLAPISRIICTLDPRFKAAYSYTTLALGDAGQADDATAIFDEAIRQFPDDPWFPYHAGMTQFFFGSDYEKAAHYFERAARLPGSPPEAPYFAARMYEKASRRDLAVRSWLQIYRSTRDSSVKKVAERGLHRLGVEGFVDTD